MANIINGHWTLDRKQQEPVEGVLFRPCPNTSWANKLPKSTFSRWGMTHVGVGENVCVVTADI